MLFRIRTLEWVGVSSIGQRHFFPQPITRSPCAAWPWVDTLPRGAYAHDQEHASWVLSVMRRDEFFDLFIF